MKTKCFIFLLAILFTNLLTAQFHLKLSLDTDGFYSVKLKADLPLTDDFIVGSGQITITAPFGGFEVGDITSIGGSWTKDPDFVGKDKYPDLNLPHDYFIIGVRDGDGIFSRDVAVGEEIILFTFRNTGYCTGPIELLTAEDPFVTDQNFEYPSHDLSTFDSQTGNILNISGVYDAGNADCRIGVTPPTEFGGTGPADDFDKDGITNSEDQDDDNDGVRDSGDFNPYDPNSDSDGDGITDFIETRGDGVYDYIIDTNPLDDDTDNDLIKDGKEDANQNGIRNFGETNPLDADTDDDGLIDGIEDLNFNCVFDENETDPFNPDTDQDGLLDGAEDINKNGIVDDGETDPRIPDSDEDGTIDGGGYAHDLNFKVSLNDAGLYEVILVSKMDASQISTLKGQISLVIPSGGFKLSNFTAIHGKWDYTYLTTPISERDEDYILFKLSQNFPNDVLLIGREVVLFTFKNEGICTGGVEVYPEERDIVFEDKTYELGFRLSAFIKSPVNGQLVGLYNQGVYDKGSADCSIYIIPPNEIGDTSATDDFDAPTKLILQPNAAEGKDAHVAMSTNGYDGGGGAAKTLFNSAWTQSGVPFTHRSMVEFDLSKIPENATIVDAKLSLYAYDGPEMHSQRDGSNACWVERVISNWDEDGVKWSNQPSTTTDNRIEIPGTSDVTKDYELDVKHLVQDMVNDPANSFGFFIKLQTESHYRSMVFCTSDYSDASKHPKLVVTYESDNEESIDTTEKGFEFQLYQDDRGYFTLSAVATTDFSNLSLEKAQITLTAPKDGLSVIDFNTVGPSWDMLLSNSENLTTENDLITFKLTAIDEAFKTHFKSVSFQPGDVIELFSFRNETACLGPISILKEEENIINERIYNIFDVIDLVEDTPFGYAGVNEIYSVDCSTNNSMSIDSSGLTDSVFLLKIEQDETGLFTIYAKSLRDMTEPLLGSVQVTLVSPEGGLVVKDFEFHAGLWENYILDKKEHPLSGDYNIFVSKNTNPLSENSIKAGEAIKLFSFRNSVECLGSISFISPEFMPTDNILLNIGINFDVIDLFDNKVYHYLGTYGATFVDCLQDTTEGGTDDNLGIEEIKVTNRTLNSACLEWEAVANASNYELQVRHKGVVTDWGNTTIKTQQTKIYFYTPVEKNYEYRVITYYENGAAIISDIFELPAFSFGLD